MIKTIILDLDGPLLDGRVRHYRCYSDILLENGFTPMPIDEYWEMKRQRIDRHKQLAVSGADGIYNDFLKAWMERIEEKKYLELDRLQPGAVQKLKEWKSSGVKLVLVTMRNNKSNLYWQLELFELLQLLHQVVVVGTTGEKSNKADAVKPHIKQLSSESVLWIGDTEVDIKAALLLGVKACAVGCGLRTPDYLSTLNPNYLVSYLKEINLSEMSLL